MRNARTRSSSVPDGTFAHTVRSRRPHRFSMRFRLGPYPGAGGRGVWPQQMMADDVYPQPWDGPDKLDDLWAHFRAEADFYREAADRGEGVLRGLA